MSANKNKKSTTPPKSSSASSTTASSSKPIQSIIDVYVKYAYNVITSEQTQRLLYSSVTFSALFVIGIAVACVLYMLFYFTYVPHINYTMPIYFQYGHSTETNRPTAVLPLYKPDQTPMLTAGQNYRISVELLVPTSEDNLQLGNFMIGADVYSYQNYLVKSSARPAILKYQSGMVKTISTLMKTIPVLLGFLTETQTINMVLFEKLAESEITPSLTIHLHLSDSRLRLYEAKLTLNVTFVGLRYFMYHWYITSLIFGVTLIFMLESIWAFAAWRVFKRLFHHIFPHRKTVNGHVAGKNISSEPSTNEKKLDGSDRPEVDISNPPPPDPASSSPKISPSKQKQSESDKNTNNTEESNASGGPETQTSSETAKNVGDSKSSDCNASYHCLDSDVVATLNAYGVVALAADVYSSQRKTLQVPNTKLEQIGKLTEIPPQSPIISEKITIVPDVDNVVQNDNLHLQETSSTVSCSMADGEDSFDTAEEAFAETME